MEHDDQEQFGGTPRFEIRRRLGHGGMGVVYQVYDRVRLMEVALKTLRNVSPSAIYRLKQEFRALADVSHGNLVTLHELFNDDDRWFFTMELVKGQTFMAHVRQAGAFHESLSTGELLDSTLARTAVKAAGRDLLRDSEDTHIDTLTSQRAAATIVNLRRLRASLRQLVEGVCALHAAGRIHRDIKPPNVLVDETGRVVILDFGLAAELMPDSARSATEQGRLIGTPAYMAPEQAVEQSLTPASDWYAVGIMLYEALTGRLPFRGTGLQQLLRKSTDTPLTPSAIAPGIPKDLGDLAIELLQKDPANRPDGQAILSRLAPGTRAPSVTGVAQRAVQRQKRNFVGRQQELQTLFRAQTQAAAGEPTAIYVRGRSGMGKTALVQHFLENIEAREDTLILRGRCYESESVPYKAIDSVIDALSHYLRDLPRLEVEAVLPRNARALTRVFPVLERVPAIADAPMRRAGVPDPNELRRRAFKALKELLARISDRRTLIVHIDDLQWGDIDSAEILQDLTGPPEPPAMLLIGTFRSEEAESNGLLRRLLPADEDAPAAGMQRPWIIDLGELCKEDSIALASGLLPDGDEGRAETIAKEAAGHPFLVETLAHHARSPAVTGELTLEGVLRHRVSNLDDDPRRLLETIAVSGRPLPQQIAFRAAGITVERERAAMDVLRTANLVRTHTIDAEEADSEVLVEAYHDRIRETVSRDLPIDALKQRHLSLALTMEMLRPDDAYALSVHFQESDDPVSAASYSIIAGDQAFEALAFDRAARMYFAALSLVPDRDRTAQSKLLVRLGESLANAGRGTEAAHIFLVAAADAETNEAIEIRRKAASQFLTSGRVKQGIDCLQSVLQDFDIEFAPTPEAAAESIQRGLEAVTARGLAFAEKAEAEIPRRTRVEIDSLATAAIGLGMIDTVRAADFQLKHLRLALDAGEPVRVARALALEASFVAGQGGRSRARLEEVREAAIEITRQTRNPGAQGLSSLAVGVAAYLTGDWPRAHKQLERTTRLLSTRCTGVTWELNTAHFFLVGALSYLGELPEMQRRLFRIMEDADRRGDLYAATLARTGHSTSIWLIRDEPDEAIRQVETAMARWPDDNFYLQHYLAARSTCDALLYQGKGAEAYRKMLRVWGPLESSRLADGQYVWIDSVWLRARTALSAASGADRDTLLAATETEANRLQAEAMPWSSALAVHVRALAAAARGDTATAITLLGQAIDGLESSGMALHATAAKYRLGTILGGERGESLTASAAAFLTTRGVVNPAAFINVFAPQPND